MLVNRVGFSDVSGIAGAAACSDADLPIGELFLPLPAGALTIGCSVLMLGMEKKKDGGGAWGHMDRRFNSTSATKHLKLKIYQVFFGSVYYNKDFIINEGDVST